jgi:esterase
MELAYVKSGKGGPLVILHGLYGSSDNWFTVGKALSEHFEVYIVDQRNHGRSPHSPEQSYEAMVEDLYEFFGKHDISMAVILGHSMGGKTAMAFCLKHGGLAGKLIAVDISPADYNIPGSKEVSTHLNIISAMQQLDPRSVSGRDEADRILSGAIPSKNTRNFLLKNLKRGKDGKFYWALNLDAIAANIEEISGSILPAGETVKSEIPSLFIKGEKSDYIKEKDEKLIHEIFPRSRFVTIPGAGHWVHAEQPALFLEALKDFLL